MSKRTPKHPMQPVIRDDRGVVRFKRNAIIDWLVSSGKLDLNLIATQHFPNEDRMQLAQLIGYSVSGYGDLSYASRQSVSVADRRAEKLLGRHS